MTDWSERGHQWKDTRRKYFCPLFYGFFFMFQLPLSVLTPTLLANNVIPHPQPCNKILYKNGMAMGELTNEQFASAAAIRGTERHPITT